MDEPKASPEIVPPRRRRKRLLFWGMYALFLLLIGECGARLLWVQRDVPFLETPNRLYRSFYPGVARLEREFGHRDAAECYDVLLLGGSVLHTTYGDVEHVLRERLSRQTRRCIRIHNLADAAHTSLDSFYKYKHLGDLSFDLVVVYHGINEVRANNCPVDVFREDYAHLSWYKLINSFERSANSRWAALPYTANFIFQKTIDRLGWSNALPTHRPTDASVEYGCDVKTVASLRVNIGGIVDAAAQREEPVVLMSFAFHVPADYSEERFSNRELDYTAHAFPIELWGKPQCVTAALVAHNDVVETLASRSEQVLFVDQNGGIPKERRYFNDICHLTHEGCERFVQNLLDVLPPLE